MSDVDLPLAIRPHLQSTWSMLKCAFPNGVEEEAYFPLLGLLADEMSIRNLAQVVAPLVRKAYERVLNDVYRAKSTDAPTGADLEAMRQRLLPCGYDEWLRSD